MNHHIQKILTAAIFCSTIATSALAQTMPKETLSATASLTAASMNSTTVRLSKNLFRTETDQVPYIVQVPYQATETYQVEVPYQVDVPYTDYETDYRQEQRCENVTLYKDEYRCENVTKYRDEYKCENVTKYRNEQRCEDRTSHRQQCHNEQKCYIVPGSGGEQCRDVEECGTNAQGQKICKIRRVCDQPGEPQQRCENKQVCENVPYTERHCSNISVPYTENECRNVSIPYTDQQCRNVQVPYTERQCKTVSVPYRREVTKHRTETRTRTESRTRTVTKYRDEERCCKPKTRTVFDQQISYQVEINFPAAAMLVAAETEMLDVTLDSNAKPTSITISDKNSIYGYQILSQSISGEVITVNLGLRPKYDLSNAGETSIKSLQMTYSEQLKKFVVVVEDRILDSVQTYRLQSTATIEVRDLTTDQFIEEQPVTALINGKNGIVIHAQLSSDAKLKAILKTKRQGLLVANGFIEFIKTSTYEASLLTAADLKSLSDSTLLKLSASDTTEQNASMQLTDATNEFSDVFTNYNITIMELLANDTRKTLAIVSLSRDQLKAANNILSLRLLLGTKANASLVKGKNLRLHIEALRSGPTTLIKKPLSIVAKASIKIR